jgi:alkylation response protein AidB-like acyl-CoA dehydrogenase
VLLVSARTAGAPDGAAGISLFAVPREGPGVAL